MIFTSLEKDFLPGFGSARIGGNNPLFVIAGPCIIEDRQMLFEVARSVQKTAHENNVFLVFKSSYDKANRSSIDSYRGPGIAAGLALLAEVKKETGLPILTDVHWPHEVEQAAGVADILQIPAFLSRQTDLLVEAARSGKWVNVKKGQFIAPHDIWPIIEKIQASGSDKVLVTERGYTFGYNNLVVDMRGIEIMRRAGAHVIIDITHSTQLPGGGKQSGGDRQNAFPLARAAVATGVEGVFMEVHPNPPQALSDSTNQLYLADFARLLKNLVAIDSLVKNGVSEQK